MQSEKGETSETMTMDIVKHNGGKPGATADDDEYTIKPQAVTPQLDTSTWPLLLKNYDKRKCPPGGLK